MPRCTLEHACAVLTCHDIGFCNCCVPKSTGDARRLKWVGIFLILFFLVFVLMAIFVPPAIQSAFDSTLYESAIISPEGLSWDLFKDNSDHPMKLEVMMWNITNPREILAGETPQLSEVGPFVYWVYRTVLPDYSFTDQKQFLDWRYYEHYEYDADLSISDDLTSNLTLPNMPFWGITNTFLSLGQAQILNYFVGKVKADGPYADEINMAFATRPVREHLFGYPADPLLTTIAGAGMLPSGNYSGIITNFTSVEDATVRIIPDRIATGSMDRAVARSYLLYHNSSYVQVMQSTAPVPPCPWNTTDPTIDQCLVRGFDGGAIPPFADFKGDLANLNYDMFYTSLFRHVNLQCERKQREHDVMIHRFRFNEKEWQDKTTNEYNIPYNQTVHGIIPLIKPIGGSPLTTSRPYFLSVPDEYKNSVTLKTIIPDIDPTDVSKYDTFFDLEGRTGSTLRFQSTSQLNVDIGRMDYSFDDDDAFMTQSLATAAAAAVTAATVASTPLQVTSTSEAQARSAHLTSLLKQAAPDARSSSTPKPTACGFSPSTRCALDFSSFTLPQDTSNQPQDIIKVTYFANMKTGLHNPLFWAAQGAGITEPDLKSLGLTFSAVDRTVSALPIVFGIIGALCGLLGLFLVVRSSKIIHTIQTEGHVLYEPDANPPAFDGKPANYDQSIDALDSIYVSQSTPTNMHRSASVVSNHQNRQRLVRPTSFDHLHPQSAKGGSYGGIELK